MTRTKIKVPFQHFREVNQAIKQSGVKFYPFSKGYNHYVIEFEPADHPLCTFLVLKFDGLTLTQTNAIIDNKEI